VSLFMMKYLALFIVIILSILTACSDSTTNLTDTELMQQKVQTLVDSMWQSYAAANNLDIGGILYHAQHHDQRYFCKSNLSSEISSFSHFRAASITKTFTASSIMLLDQRDLLDIDDCICDIIPDSDMPYLPNNAEYAIPFKEEITIRQLLEHRAGVFDLINFDVPDSVNAEYAGMNWLGYILDQDEAHFFTIDEIISVIAENQLYSNEPEAEYSYSNTGYMLLGKIIERVSGMDIEGFFLTEWSIPNALGSISFPVDSMHNLPEDHIPCVVYLDKNPCAADVYNMSHEIAQGNLVTNSTDLLSWLMNWQRGTAGLPGSIVQQMRQSSYPNQNYGLGTSFSEGFGYGHTGALAGFITLMFYDPDTDFGFVLLSNLWDMRDAGSLKSNPAIKNGH